MQKVEGNLLIKEYIYSQQFAVKQNDYSKFEVCQEKYIDYMLNELGLFFYKATTFQGEKVKDSFPLLDEESYTVSIIHFYMYTYDHLMESKGLKESLETNQHLQKFFDDLVDQKTGFKTRIDFEGKTYLRRPECHSIDLPEDSYYGDIEGLNWGVLKTFIFWWLIVPRIQTDFFDIIYQMYAFDLAHQGWFPKFAHFFTIPGNVVFSLCFLAQFKLPYLQDYTFGPFELNNFSFVAASILAFLYVVNGFRYKLPSWGISTAIVVYILLAVAQLFYSTFKVEGNPWYNPTITYANPLLWCYISSLLEGFSHIIVPQLPPYVTGINTWQGTLDFFLQGRPLYLGLSLINAFTFAPAVSYMSWPHLIGNMVLCQLFGVGYHAEFYAGYKKMVEKACLSGNPSLDKVPENFKELIHGVPGNSGTKQPATRINSTVDAVLSFFKKIFEDILFVE